jgi:hypothetical protein
MSLHLAARGLSLALALFVPLCLGAVPDRSPPSLATLDQVPTLAERIGRIERFVHERYYDADGLMYSHWNWREERPFVPADFQATDSTMMGPEPHAWMSYENSSFISGLFLAAQCFRYQATRDPVALDYAQRAFHSLDVNYRLTEHHDPSQLGPNQRAGIVDSVPAARTPQNGFFCKPYYGQATDHTSTEQHFGPLFGLYHYFKTRAPGDAAAHQADVQRGVPPLADGLPDQLFRRSLESGGILSPRAAAHVHLGGDAPARV